jgi:predicted RNA binding protein YcfA (HicA-like mRNA interferase family)
MKVKILKSKLSSAGFILLCGRGKGSHSVWRHSFYPISVVQSGKDSSDAKPYQLKTLKLALKLIQEN